MPSCQDLWRSLCFLCCLLDLSHSYAGANDIKWAYGEPLLSVSATAVLQSLTIASCFWQRRVCKQMQFISCFIQWWEMKFYCLILPIKSHFPQTMCPLLCSHFSPASLSHFCHFTMFIFFLGQEQLQLLILDWTRHNSLEQGKKFPHESAMSFHCTWNSYSQRPLPSRWTISVISHSAYIPVFFMAISRVVSLPTD